MSEFGAQRFDDELVIRALRQPDAVIEPITPAPATVSGNEPPCGEYSAIGSPCLSASVAPACCMRRPIAYELRRKCSTTLRLRRTQSALSGVAPASAAKNSG